MSMLLLSILLQRLCHLETAPIHRLRLWVCVRILTRCQCVNDERPFSAEECEVAKIEMNVLVRQMDAQEESVRSINNGAFVT